MRPSQRPSLPFWIGWLTRSTRTSSFYKDFWIWLPWYRKNKKISSRKYRPKWSVKRFYLFYPIKNKHWAYWTNRSWIWSIFLPNSPICWKSSSIPVLLWSTKGLHCMGSPTWSLFSEEFLCIPIIPFTSSKNSFFLKFLQKCKNLGASMNSLWNRIFK